MAWIPKEKEIEAVQSADGKRRYEYFIHRVCDTRTIWGLYDNGWASLCNGQKNLFPLWPHQVFAERFKRAEWSSYSPRSIALEDFVQSWIPGMRARCVAPAVFPNASGNAVSVSLDDLEANLRHERQKSFGEEV